MMEYLSFCLYVHTMGSKDAEKTLYFCCNAFLFALGKINIWIQAKSCYQVIAIYSCDYVRKTELNNKIPKWLLKSQVK